MGKQTIRETKKKNQHNSATVGKHRKWPLEHTTLRADLRRPLAARHITFHRAAPVARPSSVCIDRSRRSAKRPPPLPPALHRRPSFAFSGTLLSVYSPFLLKRRATSNNVLSTRELPVQWLLRERFGNRRSTYAGETLINGVSQFVISMEIIHTTILQYRYVSFVSNANATVFQMIDHIF